VDFLAGLLAREMPQSCSSKLNVAGSIPVSRSIPRFRDQMQRPFGTAISTRWSSEANGENHFDKENAQ